MSLKSQIESLLFISLKPMTARQLAGALKVNAKEAERALGELLAEYKKNQSGIELIADGASYQMVTAPANGKAVGEFIKDETTGELSRPSLETLTIIAYRGPISKIDLDRIRGVNCSLIIRNLLLRGLIEEKSDKKKNETYYTITVDFVRFLGINHPSELPDYGRLHQHDSIDRMLEQGEVIKN